MSSGGSVRGCRIEDPAPRTKDEGRGFEREKERERGGKKERKKLVDLSRLSSSFR